MGLFGFGKKKEEKKEVPNFACSLDAKEEDLDEEILKKASGNGEIKSIKILGSGCKSCGILFENTKTAVADLGLPIEVEEIDDLEIVMGYGVMQVPALVINEKVVSVGKALKVEAIKEIFTKA